MQMPKKISFDWSKNSECIIDPGEHEIRLSFDQIQIFTFLATHGKNIIAAYRANPEHQKHCPCCGPEMLEKIDENIEELMFNMSLLFDLYAT